MTAGLKTFAKVRTLHDRAATPGEKAAAAGRMEALARSAGMTVAQAVSKMDAPKPKTQAEAMAAAFNDLFNSPEARAARAKRDREAAERRAVALAEYGSEDAVWAENAWEIALKAACRPVIVRKPIIGGEMDTLMGWDGGRLRDMPPEVRETVSRAYPLPATARTAWAEFSAWEKLTDDRCAFWPDYSPDVRARARTAILEHLLDTLPAAGMHDLRARLDWMQYVLNRGWSRDVHEDQACLDALRADIERIGRRIQEKDGAVGSPNRANQHAEGQDNITTLPKRPDGTSRAAGVDKLAREAEAGNSVSAGFLQDRAGTTVAVHFGHPHRPTRAERHAAIRALLAEGWTDREVARRLGCSPSTVGAVRKARL